LGMLSALMASVIWLLVATWRGWPVSTTHTVVGAIVGFNVLQWGFAAVNWVKLLSIVGSWFLTPLSAAVCSYFLFKTVQYVVFDVASPLMEARIWLPVCAGAMTLLIATLTIWGCLPSMGIVLNNIEATGLVVFLVVVAVSVNAWWVISLTKAQKNLRYTQQIDQVEEGFGALTVFTACAMAFSHGGNDISNALGPMAAILDIVHYRTIVEDQAVPYYLVVMGAGCVVLGLATYGYRIMQTIGTNITHLTPSRAFAAEFSTALIVMVATVLGYPVSTTQTLVGSILGVGMARGVGAINLHVVRTIVTSWAFTLPIGAGLSGIIYTILCAFLL